MDKQIAHYEAKLAYEIDAWDLSVLLNQNEKVIVIDARAQVAFDREHIPNAINFPHRTMDASSTKDLDRTALYVTYCDGIGCNASTKGALNMARLGFRVKELMGGIAWWKRDGYPTEGTQACAAEGALECGCD